MAGSRNLISLCLLVTLAAALVAKAAWRVPQQGPETYPMTVGALDAISARYKVRFGLESSPADQGYSPIRLDLSAGKVSIVLDSLVAQRPMYLWKLRDGVYDVYPSRGASGLLSVRIRRYSVADVLLSEASRGLTEVPEVKAWLARHGVRRRDIEVGSIHRDTGPRVSLTLRDVTFQTLLNQLLNRSKGKDWVVIPYEESTGRYVAIYLYR